MKSSTSQRVSYKTRAHARNKAKSSKYLPKNLALLCKCCQECTTFALQISCISSALTREERFEGIYRAQSEACACEQGCRSEDRVSAVRGLENCCPQLQEEYLPLRWPSRASICKKERQCIFKRICLTRILLKKLLPSCDVISGECCFHSQHLNHLEKQDLYE